MIQENKEAFLKIKERLETDVGKIISFVVAERTEGRDWCPWFGLLRMLFPIAESLGNLLYNESSSKNLTMIMAEELSKYNEGYRSFPNTITLLYRHSLTHQDEPRIVLLKSAQWGWKFSFYNKSRHLQVDQSSEGDPMQRIEFDVTQFYDDLIQLCDDLAKRNFNRTIIERYNEWFTLNLVAGKKLSLVEIEAKKEIETFLSTSPK